MDHLTSKLKEIKFLMWTPVTHRERIYAIIINYKNEQRTKKLNENVQLNINRNEIDVMKHGFSVWCLTGTGPFKDFLYKLGKTDSCESPCEHLS